MRSMAVILAMLFAAASAAADVPIVATRFLITGKSFTAGMGAGKVQAEREVGAAIARLAQDKYPFFNWREESDAARAPLAASFIVILREEEVDDTRSAFYLDYQRKVAGDWRASPLKLGVAREFYTAAKRSKPYSDRVTLSGDVVKRLTEQLDKLYKSDFENGFIKNVPLCACTVSVQDAHTIVIKGFAWANMKATRESWLYVKVVVRKLPNDGPEFIPSGWIRLTNLVPAGAEIGGHLGEIHCANADLQGKWDQERIVDALNESRVQTIAVYVQQYDFDDSVQPAQNPD